MHNLLTMHDYLYGQPSHNVVSLQLLGCQNSGDHDLEKYRNYRWISTALLFFSRRFERISFFCEKTRGYCSSVWNLPAIKLPSHQLGPWWPPPTQRPGAVASKLKKRLRRWHALVTDDASCAFGFINQRNHHLVSHLVEAFRDDRRK
jgi:hypothetical protein